MAEPRPILTAAEMRAAEQKAIAGGIAVETLMERAGAAVAEAAWRIAGTAETLIVCGPGNNGGDGYVAARLLKARGVPVRLAASAPASAAAARWAASLWDGPIETLPSARAAPLIVDALFGTGLSRGLDAETAQALSRLCKSAHRRIAVICRAAWRPTMARCSARFRATTSPSRWVRSSRRIGCYPRPIAVEMWR